jgi:hypothetical protein
MKAKKGKAGRPRKITLAKVNEVGELMATGVPERYACALAGVNAETFGPAVSRNPEFREAMEKHHARFMADSLKIIAQGGEVESMTSGDKTYDRVKPWTGRAWILERRYKPWFNKTDTVAMTDPKGASLPLTADDMKELEQIGREMTAKQVKEQSK